ncbi:MAG: antibiotic biosynthesis monooxygenase [Burkholderiales bacterium]|nr:antibiotic biosynthesis monooxygenase [Anaerolineae bacterium]
MYVIHVHVQAKPEFVEEFRAATVENARNSVNEPGVVRFDVYQQEDDPTRFVLVEVYKSPDDHPKHRETAHYLTWRDTVTDMMAAARTAVRYNNIFPQDSDWK